MEEDILKLILEFVCRKSVCDSHLCRLMQKAALLRKIQLEIYKGSVSEQILELLEIIEVLDYKEGVSVLDSMKDSYCAVAAECTVKILVENGTTDGKYFDAVKRIWRGKIHEMENSPMVGLVSERLLEWWDDVETARWNRRVREDILARNTRNDALRLVQAYVAEAWAVTVPPFLEMVARPSKPVEESPGAAANSPDVATGSVVPNQNKVGDPPSATNIHLPCPKRRAVSHLRKYESTKFSRRRKMRKWSILEEDALRTGVQRFDKGNWTLILNSYRDIFEERTPVDLKDKWRNMTK